MRLGVLISGRGSNLLALIHAIETNAVDADIRIVISNNPTAEGLKKAASYGIKCVAVQQKEYDSKEAFEARLIDLLKQENLDLIVLAGYMRVLGDAFIDAFEGNIVNIHPSLLPSFKGLHAQRQALEAGVKKAGCTVHFVDKTLDGGPIIAQAVVDVLENDTEESLSNRILEQEHTLYPQAIQTIIQQRRNYICER